MNEIKEFAFNFLQSSNESELCNDEWLTFNPSIDLNMHDMEGVISIQAYPVVDNNVVTSSMVHVAALPTYKLDFDALEYFGHSDNSELTPKEIAFTNVMEHITNEIELFKSIGTSIGLVTASELYAFYQTLIQKRSES
jgi:hypothetical protein